MIQSRPRLDGSRFSLLDSRTRWTLFFIFDVFPAAPHRGHETMNRPPVERMLSRRCTSGTASQCGAAERPVFVPLVVASQMTCLFFSFALFFFGTVRIEFVVVITSLETDRSNTILYGEQAGCAAVISYLALVCCHTLDLRCYLVNNCIIHMAPCV